METLVKLAITWLLVDLISGVVHWCEDSYGHPAAPFIGRRITKPNLLHHFRPRAFVTNSWYASSQLLVFSSVAAVLIAWAIGRLSPMVVLGAALGANANQVHKWSHRTSAENGRVIRQLQRLRLIQSPAHHQRHHSGGKDSHYCVLTDFLNPVLDGLRVWRRLEWMLQRSGLAKRNDDELLGAVLAKEPGFLNTTRS